jgi:hypothetical protein
MKISTNTLNVLKNFAKINPSIIIAEGNVLKSISPSKTIIAKATVDTEFSKRFAIYNLNRFISTVSLFKDPELKFGDNSVDIREGGRSTVYVYADESTLTKAKAPEKDLALPSIDASFTLKHENLKEVESAAGVLELPEIAVVGKDGKIHLMAIDSKNPSGDVYSVEIGDSVKDFRAIFKYENIKIIPDNYEVSISSRGISHFSGSQVDYWIAVEQNSTF